MQEPVVIDTRKDWMKEEDRLALCWNQCSLYKYCASRIGKDCKHLGGEEIPKIRG